ncbi:MAG: hypothetical protein ACPGWR_11580 [Ardenticatenaceae bacterium]
MATIRLAIEGPGAIEATEELVSIPELSADWEEADEGHRSLTLATVVTILGMVSTGIGVASGTVSVAQQIYSWYQEWSEGKEETMIEKAALVMPDGTQILLENTTPQELGELLQQL